MTSEQYLYVAMVSSGMEIHPGTMDSLREAIEKSNIYFFEENGKPTGFVTWYYENGELVVNNLCTFEGKRIKNLFLLRKMFHVKYPELKKVKWHDEKHNRVFESRFERN